MKKIIMLLICLFPLINVTAENEKKELTCKPTTYDEPFKIGNGNFACSNVEGDTLTFFQNDTDLKDYFKYNIDNGIATITVSDTLKFDSSLKSGLVKIGNGKSTFVIYIENNAYVKPTEASTTTTKVADEITYTIILNNKGKTEEKKCNVKKSGDTCYVNLPNLEDEGFKGWGSSNTCKNGNIGNIKVNKNDTYYACYEIQEESTTLYLKSLKILDNNNEKINFGTFSIKKQEYEFKVLNEVETLTIEAEAEDNVKIEYINHENLVIGVNEVIIKLTDDNNVTNEYKLKVTRLKEGETINNINYLKALVIGNYSIDFNKNVFNYNIVIDKDIYKLVINAKPLNENHLVEINNNNNLEDGSVINVDVLDGEGRVTTYKINITKESNNMLLYFAIGTIVLLIIILIILIIIKKQQKKKIKKEAKKDKSNESNIEVLNI